MSKIFIVFPVFLYFKYRVSPRPVSGIDKSKMGMRFVSRSVNVRESDQFRQRKGRDSFASTLISAVMANGNLRRQEN